MVEPTLQPGCVVARVNTPTPPSPTEPRTWQDDAACAGHTALMYDNARISAARAVCRGCPVTEVCLWATLAVEVTEEFRYGLAGALRPAQRRRLAGAMSHADIGARLTQALADWQGAPTRPAWVPSRAKNRPWRKCRGCKAMILQPRAGRPQVWCSKRCHQRHRDHKADAARAAQRWFELPEEIRAERRAADAGRNLQRWHELPEEIREDRRAAMRARWANLPAAQRAEAAARKRLRRHTQDRVAI